MRWIYITMIAVVFIFLAVLPPPAEPVLSGIAEMISMEADVPNSVAGILLRNRLYDTLFELLVFTLAVLGVQYAFSQYEAEEDIFHLSDPTIVILARIGAMVSALIFLEMALRGHLAPGGGFAAGVAGGTAIGLVTLTGNAHELHDFHVRWHIGTVEKAIVLIMVMTGLFFLQFPGFCYDDHAVGTTSIPLLNILIALKVAIGSWTITLLFIRHRGLL